MTHTIRRITSTLVAAEAVLLLFAALFLIIESFISEAKNFDALLAEIFFAILGGLALLIAARGIRNGKRYGNAPALLANLIALAVSYYVYQGGWWGIALPLACCAVVTICGVLYLTAKSANPYTE